MNAATFTMALLMGFTGSLHCAGMCGPIVWIMPFQSFPGFRKAVAIALYHLGRISMYAMLAILLHSFRGLFDPRVQQVISLGLGGILLVAGIISFLPGQAARIRLPWSGFVQQQLARVIGQPGLGTILAAGILNGLLPCGLVYMALSASLALPGTGSAALMMYVFGLGTLPMLVSISVLKTRVAFAGGRHFRRLVPVFVFAFGCLFMLRGLNLGIPYLSPKVAMTQHGIKACCCHKK